MRRAAAALRTMLGTVLNCGIKFAGAEATASEFTGSRVLAEPHGNR